jgi:transposase
MVRPDAKVEKVYLHPKPVDFRKSIDGLTAMVELDRKVAVFDPVLFVFLNKARNRVKILYWERNGFCLWLKRLEAERFKTSPEISDEAIILSAEEAEEEVVASAKRRGKRKPLPAELPRIEVIHQLPEHPMTCVCGCRKHAIGEDISEQLDIVPMQIRVLKHIRTIYACRGCEAAPVTAGKPAQLIEKSLASPSVLAMLLTTKYVDGLPLYRFEKGHPALRHRPQELALQRHAQRRHCQRPDLRPGGIRQSQRPRALCVAASCVRTPAARGQSRRLRSHVAVELHTGNATVNKTLIL